MRSCDAIIVLIGDDWIEAKDESGRRRLDDSGDLVRSEIAASLARDILVVPVLVEHARMPSESDLPAPIKKLARRNALDLSDMRWDYDVQKLIAALESHVRHPPTGDRDAPVDGDMHHGLAERATEPDVASSDQTPGGTGPPVFFAPRFASGVTVLGVALVLLSLLSFGWASPTSEVTRTTTCTRIPVGKSGALPSSIFASGSSRLWVYR